MDRLLFSESSAVTAQSFFSHAHASTCGPVRTDMHIYAQSDIHAEA